jgi:hypothetical protein
LSRRLGLLIVCNDGIFRPPKCSCAASFGVNRIISELVRSMQMWRTKDQDARGGKTIPANFACDVMLDKILGLSDFTIVAAGPIPILEPALNRKLRNRSFGHVRLVAIAGALVVHCQEKTSLTLQSQAMHPSWSGAWRNANSTNSASTTSITTLRCWFYAVPSSRLMLLCKNH